MTTITLHYRAVHHKITSLHVPRIPWKLMYFFGILSSVLLLVFYIFLVNELTKGSYVIKNYNKEISDLSGESRILETNFANTDFLARAMEKSKELSFEKTTNITYVQILENSLAQAQKNPSR